MIPADVEAPATGCMIAGAVRLRRASHGYLGVLPPAPRRGCQASRRESAGRSMMHDENVSRIIARLIR
jgi:hypothetical protein